LGVKILMPEQERWADDLAELALDDENTRQYVDVVAGHGYWWNRDGHSDPGEPLPFEKAQSHGIKVWETEICNTAAGCFSDMADGLMWGENIHRYLVNAEASAWLWWWIMTEVADDGESLKCFRAQWRKLTWVIGQYSRFVRPGFYRVTTDAPNDGVSVLITAFKEKETGNFAIVILNQGGATTVDFTFNGGSPEKVTPWTTTDAANIEKGSDITVTDGSFTASLPGLSATTFVGTGTPTVEVKEPADVNFEKGKTDFCVTGRILTLSDNLIGKALTVSVYSINGRLLNQITVSSKGSSRIELPETSAGANLIQIKTENGITVKKIINR
jgi:glucuronoarabinoxylan endo-1,4-beta-xylanase